MMKKYFVVALCLLLVIEALSAPVPDGEQGKGNNEEHSKKGNNPKKAHGEENGKKGNKEGKKEHNKKESSGHLTASYLAVLSSLHDDQIRLTFNGDVANEAMVDIPSIQNVQF